MVLVRVFAAFCAADSTDPKKPEEGFRSDGVGTPFSRVGVSGADDIVDNLLGTRLADPDLGRFCVNTAASAEALLLRGARNLGCWSGSVGVGGVLTMTGVSFSEPPGVPGGVLVVVMGGPLEKRRVRSVDRLCSPFPAFSSIAALCKAGSASMVV